jgi:hypothetical protein
MVMEARQERRIRHRSGDRIARSNATTGRISEPRCRHNPLVWDPQKEEPDQISASSIWQEEHLSASQ